MIGVGNNALTIIYQGGLLPNGTMEINGARTIF